jgi:toxin HigB-1
MISSFACSDTEAFFCGQRVARFVNIERVAIRKLQMLNAATAIGYLRVPPNNRLEMLSADRAGQYSIRINSQWRICFGFEAGNAINVEIVDYH